MGRSAIFRAIIASAAALALAACGSAADRSRPAELRAELPTFVSLNPCLDAILAEVAVPRQVLALSHYSRDRASSSMDAAVAESFAVTGGTAEEIIALQPDIVLASTFIAPATRAALERAGLRVETFGSPASVEESLAQVRALARLAQQDQAGEALARRILADPAPPEGGEWSALLWQPDQIVAGEASLVAEHLRWAGFASYAEERGLAQADFVALETVLTDRPQVLLLAGDTQGQSHPILKRHFEDMLIAEFDPRLLYCGGPTIPLARARLLEIRAQVEGRSQ